MAAKFEIASAKSGQFNWVLKSQGRTLATGESYTRKVSAEKAIESLRKAAASATVSDLTPTRGPKAASSPGRKAASPAKATRAAKPARATKATKPVKAAKAAPGRTTAKAATARQTTAAKAAGRGRKRTAKSA